MVAQLGDIRFEGLSTPQSWVETHEATYGEIGHIGSKPSLQKTGETLLEVDLSIRLSTDFCDPSASLDLLKIAKSTGEVLPFLTGEGVMVGKFVLTSIGVEVKDTTADGELLAIVVDIALKEYVPPPGSDDETPTGEAVISPANRVPQPPAAPNITEPLAITKDISAATSAVRSAQNATADIRKGTKSLKRGVREVKQMANEAKLLYNEAKSKVNQTVKIVQRASELPTSLDEAINYADNLANIDNVMSLSTIEIRTNELSMAADKVTSRAAPIAAFVGTREGGK